MTDDDAVLSVALHHFAERRKEQGERVTALAVENIAALATKLGNRPTLALEALGLSEDYMLSQEDLSCRFAQVRDANDDYRDRLRQLQFAIQDLTVAEVEGYHEPRFQAVEADYGTDL